MTDAHSVPREQWARLVTARKYSCLTETPSDCRNLLKFVADAAECEWLGYSSRDEYLRVGLGLDPETVDLAVEFLRVMDIDVPVEYERAIDGGRRLVKHGGHRGQYVSKQSESRQDDNIILTGNRPLGTSVEYTIARLERDHPQIAKRVHSGELSANAAAIEAGFRKKPTALQILRAAWRRASEDERETFLDEVK